MHTTTVLGSLPLAACFCLALRLSLPDGEAFCCPMVPKFARGDIVECWRNVMWRSGEWGRRGAISGRLCLPTLYLEDAMEITDNREKALILNFGEFWPFGRL